MNAITQLENLGYVFTVEGEKLKYTHTGQSPDPAIVQPLLTELGQHKGEAIQFLQERATAQDSLYLACQRAAYPIAFEWLDGSRTTYTTPAESYNDLWARSMVKEAQVLGGIAIPKDETQ